MRCPRKMRLLLRNLRMKSTVSMVSFHPKMFYNYVKIILEQNYERVLSLVFEIDLKWCAQGYRNRHNIINFENKKILLLFSKKVLL